MLDSRDVRDKHDRATIQRVRSAHSSRSDLVYAHVDSRSEPLCWLADTVAWCLNTGGDWQRRAKPVIDAIIDA